MCRFEIIEGVAQLVPTKTPEVTAGLIADFFGGKGLGTEGADAAVLLTASRHREASRDEVRRAGMTVRRQVISDAHVDRANAKVGDFTADFQDLTTRYVWGKIWTRSGLERRMHSAITFTAMIADGHEAGFTMRGSAALRNGPMRNEIKEGLLQSAIYCSVPSANTSFSVSSQALTEVGKEE